MEPKTYTWKDILVRAAKTFVQGFTGAVGSVFLIPIITNVDIDAGTAWLIAGASGGVAAVVSLGWNAAVNWANTP